MIDPVPASSVCAVIGPRGWLRPEEIDETKLSMIGVAKCATSSSSTLLGRNPEVFHVAKQTDCFSKDEVFSRDFSGTNRCSTRLVSCDGTSRFSTSMPRRPGRTRGRIPYDGVTTAHHARDRTRKSSAPYYNTRETPSGWTGASHSTVFKERPHEIIKGDMCECLWKPPSGRW